jgi:nucleotide-binding universal stress UspA family protein
MSTQATIVVGVDGSECSGTALEFALDEAVRWRAALRVVAALPEAEYWATASGLSPSLLDDLSADAEKAARDMVDAVVRKRGGDLADVPVEVRALSGLPGHVLVDQSRDADLLVVGHRGRGGFRSAVLGSVGLQCVLHAEVPVTVVRPVVRSGRRRATARNGRTAARESSPSTPSSTAVKDRPASPTPPRT